MPEKKDIRKDLDELLASEYSAEERKALQLFLRTASWNRIEDGNVTIKNILTPAKYCQSQKLVDVSSYAFTGANGRAQFRLTQYICFDRAAFSYPINIVATPYGSKPVFLTVQNSLVMDPNNIFGIDVEFEVFSWDANGAAAPNITFHWRSRVPFDDPIL